MIGSISIVGNASWSQERALASSKIHEAFASAALTRSVTRVIMVAIHCAFLFGIRNCDFIE